MMQRVPSHSVLTKRHHRPMRTEQIIRNYEEAEVRYRDCLAEELKKLGDIASDSVREANAHLNVPEEIRRALELARADLPGDEGGAGGTLDRRPRGSGTASAHRARRGAVKDQRHVDRVTRAVLARRPTIILGLDGLPPDFEAGGLLKVMRTGEVMRIRSVNRDTGEVEVERMPRG
jgi:hypothetical protein